MDDSFHTVVQLLSCDQLFATPWIAAHQASLSFTISQSLLKFMFIESVMPPNHLILCHALRLPSIFPTIRIFSSELALPVRWPDYWSFSFSISPPNEHLGLISFRLDGLGLLGTRVRVKVRVSQESSPAPQFKASILLQCSAFFMVQLSHPYMTTGKTIPLTIWIFVAKVMSPLFIHYLILP